MCDPSFKHFCRFSLFRMRPLFVHSRLVLIVIRCINSIVCNLFGLVYSGSHVMYNLGLVNAGPSWIYACCGFFRLFFIYIIKV